MAIQLPLHDLHARLGARFGEVDGVLLPLDYGDPAAEHEAVRARVGLIDRSHRGVIEATGRDRASFLQGMLSNDVKALAPGQGCPAAFLDVHGKIVALLVAHCLTDRLLLETDVRLVAPTLAGLDRFLFSERVELEDASGAHGILTLAGPAARATVEKLAEQALPDLPLAHHVELTVDGIAVRAGRSEETGEEGYDLWVGRAALGTLWERVLAAGAQPIGREAWNVLRVEAGVVWYGVDVDASTLLLEAPLDHAFVLTKGCYIGQEVVARITYRGHVNRKIVGFVFPDRRLPVPGAPVVVAGKEVGRITSPVVSPALGRGVALGFLRREHWEPGTRVEVPGPDGALTADVQALPFYRRA
ncbi:MAG TPA: aminomethyltransferase family protein [Methylomirabilota bacterium]|jgi:folate-binding protein YgfZ|nr:aminomethyltransferase family protein [Methylomirabilota bacterium]